jgi:DNA-binding PadR family transcriptional regulator
MSIRYAILGLLHYTNMHGYRIKEHIERHFGHMWSINYGQIYPNLKSLEEEELIHMVELARSEDGGPHKKLYSITDKGREDFKRWLEGSPERQMLIRDPFLMRFIFFGFGDKHKALDLIDEQIKLYEHYLNKREGNMHRWERFGVYVRLMADLGLTFNKMYLAWLRNAREEIERSETEHAPMAAAGLFN